jgi:hypothetical protein
MAGNSNLYGNDPVDYTTAGGGSVQGLIDASVGTNSGWAFDVPKTPDTATVNAIQSMAPVKAPNTVSGSDYSSFWRGLVGSVVDTGVAVVVKKNGLVQPASTTPVAVAPPPNPNRVLLLVALGVGAVLLYTHKAA